MFNYKEWYEKTKEKRKVWEKEYYQKHQAHILEMHKAWAQKKVDQGGSIWRKYNKRKRIKDPFLDAKYYDSHREQILEKKRIQYRQTNFPERMGQGVLGVEKEKMSTQVKFRVRAEAIIMSLGETQGPAPCCFVTLDHHRHGVGF